MKKNSELIALLLFFPVVVIIAELIGYRSIPIVGTEIVIGILPLVFSVLITMILGIKVFRKSIVAKIYSKSNIKFASKNMIFIMLPLMARYGADIAPVLGDIFKIGYIFILQEIGNVGTVILGMPIAIMIGLKRSSIGATLGLGREGELAFITEKYTLDSDEGKGVLGIYIFGTLFGAVFFSIFSPLLLNLGFSVEALAMASGVGSGSMMAASSAALIAASPQSADIVSAYAGASQLLTSFLGTYTMFFIALPMQKFIYTKLTKEPYDLGVKNEK